MRAIEHILITAGGTAEAIDGVRQISNTGTGSLAACIYTALSDYLARENAYLENGHLFTVHYVASEKAVRPESRANLPIQFYPVTDVSSLEAVLEKLLTEHEISHLIHSMAVSDYTKGFLAEQDALVTDLANTIEQAFDSSEEPPGGERLRAMINNVLSNPNCALDTAAKVRSRSNMILSLKKTPKLIERINKISPKTFLVGFKLLKGVTEEELISTAAELLVKNSCSLVFANDMNNIRNDRHDGFLISASGLIGSYHTKKEIAEGIVENMLKKCPCQHIKSKE